MHGNFIFLRGNFISCVEISFSCLEISFECMEISFECMEISFSCMPIFFPCMIFFHAHMHKTFHTEWVQNFAVSVRDIFLCRDSFLTGCFMIRWDCIMPSLVPLHSIIHLVNMGLHRLRSKNKGISS